MFKARSFDLRWIRSQTSCTKFLVPVARGQFYIGEMKRAFNIRKKSISAEMSNQLPKAQGLQILPGHTITLQTLKTLPPLIKVVSQHERYWKLEWHNKLTPNADNNSCPKACNICIVSASLIKPYLVFLFIDTVERPTSLQSHISPSSTATRRYTLRNENKLENWRGE